jgi:hypothetical protein
LSEKILQRGREKGGKLPKGAKSRENVNTRRENIIK